MHCRHIPLTSDLSGQGKWGVAMETGWLAQQVERVERSVAFLRQDQMTLLHGLHLEIVSLQKRCTDLTCELEVQHLVPTQTEVEAEEEFLEGRCREVEMRLEEEQWTVGELQKELSQKGALVRALRCSLRDEERRFLQELKQGSHRSTELRTQLRTQTEAAAYLSFQLHSARQHLRHLHLQHPPRAQLRGERARECVPQQRVTGPEDPTPMPDPALFLHPCKGRPHPPSTMTQRLEGLEGEGKAMDTGEGCSSSLINAATDHKPEMENYN
ncbi:hypothetical protein AAFF_G00079510 [Aldrovandia affinis]|uniref:CCDC92/74 N-terminal domain-containing protein n=1 Tax=Aldrovandia affinis TaxID=143900 RepID=A0AAD7WD32_9TELE|nr:hypothetical protein AAFF_G00079510 [Aldrovandia affinis]